jgi:hypothetical protein
MFDYAEQSEGKLRSPSTLAHSKMEHHCWVANSNSALSPSLHSKVLQPTVKPNDAHTHALVGYTKRWTPEDLIGIDKKSPNKNVSGMTKTPSWWVIKLFFSAD